MNTFFMFFQSLKEAIVYMLKCLKILKLKTDSHSHLCHTNEYYMAQLL